MQVENRGIKVNSLWGQVRTSAISSALPPIAGTQMFPQAGDWRGLSWRNLHDMEEV